MLFILKLLTATSSALTNTRTGMARKLCARSARRASKLRNAAADTSARGVDTIIAMRDMHAKELEALRTKQAVAREVYRAAVWDDECRLHAAAHTEETKAAKYAEHI